MADDSQCVLADVARLRWAFAVKAPLEPSEGRRRYAALAGASDAESVAARIAVARLMGDRKLLASDLALGLEKGATDRVDAYKELAALPATVRPARVEMQRLLRRIWLATPKRARLGKLPAFSSDDPSSWAELGRAWHAAGELKAAEAAWSKARAIAGKSKADRCMTELVRGAAYKHKGPAGFEAWTLADGACVGTDEAPRARFNLSRALASVGRAADARTAFLALADSNPRHRLADDARLKAASITRDLDGEEAFRAALGAIVDGPKDADMRDEAITLLYVSHARAGAWDKALELAQQMDPHAGSESVWSGAKGAYFLGRAMEALGKKDEAWAQYSAAIQTAPGAYYMRLATTRALGMRAEDARALWARKWGVESTPPLAWSAPKFVNAPCFNRAYALSAVGEMRRATDAARLCAGAEQGPGSVLGLGVWFHQMGAFDKARSLAKGGFLDATRVPEGAQFLPWALAFPRAYEPLVRESADREGVSPALVWGIMREESSFVPDVVSPTGALGLMQLMPPTAAEVAKGTEWSPDPTSLKTAAGNIPLGTRLLGHLSRKYRGNEVLVASAYNAGEGATDRWLAKRSPNDFDLWVEEIPYEETFGYVRRVSSSAAVYRATHLGERGLEHYVLKAPAVGP